MGLPDSRRVSRVQRYLGGYLGRALFSLTGLSPSLAATFHWHSANNSLGNFLLHPCMQHDNSLYPNYTTGLALHAIGLGSYPFARRYWGNRDFLSFPGATKMFQFSPFAFHTYFIQYGILALHASRFPHSDIPGSSHVGNSPRLFAAFYVLLRFLAPKHPPYTLINLNFFSFLSLPDCQRSYTSLLLSQKPIYSWGYRIQTCSFFQTFVWF